MMAAFSMRVSALISLPVRVEVEARRKHVHVPPVRNLDTSVAARLTAWPFVQIGAAHQLGADMFDGIVCTSEAHTVLKTAVKQQDMRCQRAHNSLRS